MSFPPELVRFSTLKRIALSPAHYRAAVEEPFASSAAMRHGTLIHAICLGGDFVVYDGERRGKSWQTFAEEHEGRTIVTRAEHDRAMECARVVMTHPIAGPLLRGQREIELRWEWCGRACGGRLDVLGPSFVNDLKTTTRSEPGWFGRHALRMHYHVQAAWYREGARQNGHTADAAYLTAVEIKPPYAVTVMRLTERALEEGERIARLWMERLLGCEAVGEWPEYAQSVIDLDVPDEQEFLFAEDAEEEAA